MLRCVPKAVGGGSDRISKHICECSLAETVNPQLFDLIYLSVVVICHVVGTLHGAGHLSVSRRLSVNVTHVKLHEAGTSCVCTPSTNVCQINLLWKQYDIYSLGLFRVHSYWHLFVKYVFRGYAAVVECVVGAADFRTSLGRIQLPSVPYRGVGAWKCGRHPLTQQGLVL